MYGYDHDYYKGANLDATYVLEATRAYGYIEYLDHILQSYQNCLFVPTTYIHTPWLRHVRKP